MVEKIVTILIIFASIFVFSSHVTLITNDGFNLSLTVYHLSFSVDNSQYLVGLNLIDYKKDLITTIEKKVFMRTIKMKMKTGDEKAVFNIFFWQSPAMLAVYKKTSILPYKSESYMYFSVSKKPIFVKEGYQYVKLLGLSMLSASLSMNNFGFSYNLYGYKNVYIGYFKTATGYIVGLGDMNKEYSGIFGAGFGKGVSFGFGYFLNRSKYISFAGMSFDKGGIYPQLFVKWHFKMAEVSFLYQSGRLLISIHE